MQWKLVGTSHTESSCQITVGSCQGKHPESPAEQTVVLKYVQRGKIYLWRATISQASLRFKVSRKVNARSCENLSWSFYLSLRRFKVIIIDLVTAAYSLLVQCEATLAASAVGKWGAGSRCAAVRGRWDAALWCASCVFGLCNLPLASCRTNNNAWLISPEPFPPLRLALFSIVCLFSASQWKHKRRFELLSS